MQHCGVAIDDPRNAGAIAYFRPKEVTRESLTEMKVLRGRSPADLDARVERVMQDIAHSPVRPNPPLSQSLDDVADPWYGLGTHPEIIEVMWKLDDGLPQQCRWVFWGRPSLVHAKTGVVFAVGFGTIGYVMRLPPQVLKDADPQSAIVIKSGNPGQTFDISTAGPEWRFISPRAPKAAWCRAAYDFASEPSP